MQPYESEPLAVVLHVLHLKGCAEPEAVGEAAGLAPERVRGELAEAQERGLVRRREGRVRGWALTPAGRDEHRRRLAAERAGAGLDDLIDLAYQRFVPLNEPFKALCTDWQLHGDRAGCVARLGAVHRDVVPVLRDLGAALARMAPYEARLAAALDRVRGGDPSGFTAPLTGSYHDVWMELHEDLLVTLGRARSSTDGS